jgi:hypothetical protein
METGAATPNPEGTMAVVIWYRTLDWAVDELLDMDDQMLAGLRIRSGEHLAAILLTAFLGAAPVSIDIDGGLDLQFDLRTCDGAVGAGTLAAFETKSLCGDFRKFDAERASRKDEWRYVKVRSAADILEEARTSLEKAASSLKRKSPDGCTRNAFLIVHPFDHLAVEALRDQLVAPSLPPLTDRASIGLDTVWVLWAPDHLTMWSSRDQRWTEMIFTGVNPEEDSRPAIEGLAHLQVAESRLLDGLGGTDSPYLFKVVVPGDLADD